MGGMCCVCAAQSPISLNTVVTSFHIPSSVKSNSMQSVCDHIRRDRSRFVDANAARFSHDGVFLHGAVGI